jgi:hypothetical protein
MAFEQISVLLEESRNNDQSSPEGTKGGTICRSLLVYNNTNRAVSSVEDTQIKAKDHKIWLPKDKRAYHRILSGFKISQCYQHRLRFMTLTTSKQGRDRSLKEDTNTLIKRIRRRHRVFEYFRVRTNEGNGVVHLIFRGSYLSRGWLKNQWEDIHKSWNVDIRECQRYHQKYVVNQYICDQEGYTRYSMSGLWLPKGSLAVWKGFCKWYPHNRIALWDDFLHNWVVNQQQRRLFDYENLDGSPIIEGEGGDFYNG